MLVCPQRDECQGDCGPWCTGWAKLLAGEIKAKMENGGFVVSDVRVVDDEFVMIVTDTNETRFCVSVRQIEDEGVDENV